jgi:signal transduction histidine kinase
VSTAGTSGTLERAFHKFEKAASALERQQSALQCDVERLQRELLSANRRLAGVLDAVDGGVAVVARDGSLVRTNRAFESMGLDGTDLGRLLEGEGGSRAVRLSLRTPGGARDLAATLVSVADGEGTRVLTVQDVTEIRREEQEGGRRRRLEALGRMAAELAHEVRNPLGSIRLFASILIEDLADRAEERSMVEQILSATEGLESTVSNLLAFAGTGRGTMRELDLAKVARDACALLAPLCSARGVRLAGPAADETCAVEADSEGLRQVLLNLLGNALEATGAGRNIHVRVSASGEQAVLDVDDEGAGIASEDLPRIFDPFFTRTAGGTGLGLSIVHRTVERHGGRIGVESEPGKGTRVRVVIPTRAPVERNENV